MIKILSLDYTLLFNDSIIIVLKILKLNKK